MFVCFKEECLFGLGDTVFFEATVVLNELQNPESLAYVDSWSFRN